MDDEHKIMDLDAYLNKGGKTIYLVFALISCLGYTIDMVNFYDISNKIFYINSFSIGATFASLLLYYLKKINLKVALGILLYTAIANVMADTFSDPFSPDRIYFFLRDSLFIFFVFTLASLIIRKAHALIIASIYVATAIALTLITKNAFLQSSISIIVLFAVVYSVAVYYVVGLIQKSILTRETQAHQMDENNKVMNETNTLLEERQQQIEEQSEELASQTEILKDQSDQMELKNIELKQLNKTKDLFLSIMAHDLKNPFNAIIGFSEILEDRFEQLDDERKLRYIKLINSTSQKTYNLLENLLQWTRSQSNTIEFNPVKVAVHDLVKENVFFVLESCRNKRIKITKDISDGCYAMADENMLNTSIRNLLSNAIKFTPEGKTIHVSCKEKDGKILVEVTDTGVGIEPEDMDNLFKVDKTFSTPGTSGESGTGLGLAICKEFIEKNNGQIWATSEKDMGSSFVFSLPVCEQVLSTKY
jgi:signal transduction histidine kinase